MFDTSGRFRRSPDSSTPEARQWEISDKAERDRRARVKAMDEAVTEEAAHINAAMARLLMHLSEFIGLEGWSDHYARSPEDWVCWRLGVTPAEARNFVRVAARLPELPEIHACFTRGELSYWQVRAMVPIATPQIESELVNMARYSTAAQLARIVAAYKGALDSAELERSNERHRKRSLRYFFDTDGFLIVKGQLPPEEGAVLVSALRAAEEAALDQNTHAPEERPSSEQLSADALVEVARRSLVAPADGKPAVPEVVVHVDLPSLIAGAGERCELADGPVLASETARRLACDSSVIAMFEADGKVLDVGRKRRTVSPRLRRALERRDQTCRFPGCDRKRYREAHHIVHWPHLGETKGENLVLLCNFHHRLVHEPGIEIHGNPQGKITFKRPDGSVIPESPPRPEGSYRALVNENSDAQLKIDAATCTTLWDGHSFRYEDCVWALLRPEGKLALPSPRGP